MIVALPAVCLCGLLSSHWQKYKLTPSAQVFDIMITILASEGWGKDIDQLLETMAKVCKSVDQTDPTSWA